MKNYLAHYENEDGTTGAFRVSASSYRDAHHKAHRELLPGMFVRGITETNEPDPMIGRINPSTTRGC